MTACGVCARNEFSPFFRSREWSSSGRYLNAGQQQANSTPIVIATEYCRRCGLIRQAPGFEVQLDYTGIERDTAKQLPDYTSRIIASLAEYGVGPDELVIEIGANDGTFLRALRDAGHRNLIGVEPSTRLATRASEAGLVVHNDFFSRDTAARIARRHGSARAVICRHTLEHVPDIRGVTQGIADILAQGGLSFIEVPDTDWIVSELFAHEVWDEHITYFRAGSLAGLLRTTGLTPLRIERIRFRDTRNLLCWAVRGSAPCGTTVDLVDDATGMADLADFQFRWDAFAARLRATVSVAPKPIIAIGAAHNQLNFLNFTGLDGSVDLLVDDDPVKAGRYAPLESPVAIRTTVQVLHSVRAGTMLRTAFAYPAWEDRIYAALAPLGVGCIKPYDLR